MPPQKSTKKSSSKADIALTLSRYNKCRESWRVDTCQKCSPRLLKKPQESNRRAVLSCISADDSSKTTLKSYLDSINVSSQVFSPVQLQIVEDRNGLTNQTLLLPPFCGKFLSNNEDDTDKMKIENTEFFINASGPISSIKYSPSSSESTVSFAVGLSRIGWPLRNDDYETNLLLRDNEIITLTEPLEINSSTNCGVGRDIVRRVENLEFHHNLLQIWKMDVSSNDENFGVGLNYTVSLENRGSVIDMSWSNIKINNFLGILAVVCSCGDCLLLALPDIAQKPYVSNNYPDDLCTIDSYYSEKLLLGSITGNTTSWVTSVSWCPNNQNILCCGMSNGSIALYTIESSLNLSSVADWTPSLLSRLSDSSVDNRIPSITSITSVQICPYDPNLIMSSSVDGDIKIWDMDHPISPLFVRKYFSNVKKALWDECYNGIYYCDSETTSVYWERPWPIKEISKHRNSLYNHEFKCGGMWDITHFIHDQQSMIFSAASDGTVRGGFPSCLATLKAPNEGLMEIFCIESVETKNDTTIIKINTKPTFQRFRQRAGAIQETNVKAITSIDNKAANSFLNGQPESTLMIYGGISGIIHIQLISPKVMLTGN